MIPVPKLDDRTYADIISEALRLIPRYCPEWTNHNPSDPGITILELTAWMTELLLYRVNRIPEKNYVAFLNMLGIQLRAPQPARTLITVELVAGADRQVLPEGMQISTAQAAEDDSVVFETQRELVVIGARLDRAFSYFHDMFSDNSPFLGGRAGGFPAFAGGERVDRYLYLADSRFEAIAAGALLHVHVNAPERGGRDLARLLEWEYWNGRRWRELRTMSTEVERGEVVFHMPSDLAATDVNGVVDFFLRGRLAEVPENPWETEVDTIRVVVEVAGEGIAPDFALANLSGGMYRSLDLSKNFQPLGTAPKIDDCFYVSSRDLFAQPNADVRIELQLSDPRVHPAPGASPDLVISWEYFDGRKWRILGRTTPRGAVVSGENPWAFVDTTQGLTKTGAVTFRVPTDIAPGEVNGEASYWVRARIDCGDYGQNGSYILDGDRWVWRDERPLRPPGMKQIALLSRADLSNPRRVLSYNDFLFRDHSADAKVDYRPFQPFAAVADEGPAMYLGWDRKPPNDPLSIYIQLADVGPQLAGDSLRNTSRTTGELSDGRPDADWLKGWYASRDAAWEAEQRVVWEYFDAQKWVPLVVIDGTKNLTQSGFLEFVAPDDMAASIKFAEERFFMRARLEMGGYVRQPLISRILTNTVEAANVYTMREEVLGSSDGNPAQSFLLSQGPVLAGEIIDVWEKDAPTPEELFELGDNACRPNTGGEGFWVRWRPMDSFFDSGPKARHYLRDGLQRRFSFGDGKQGMIPPQAHNGIICRRYQIGGGVRGNVNANSLTQLTRAVAYVDRCYNSIPAAGGADAETVDEAKARAPMMLKSRDRAVTAEDFEALALRASTAVARARCLPSRDRDGEVRVVILPRADDRAVDASRRLLPAPELLRYVKNYLDERRLVATVVNVERPVYVEISLRVAIVRKVIGQSDRVKREIEDRLRKYLHPLLGGKDGDGWPFGRAVYKADLAHLVEDIPGLDSVDEVTIYDEDQRVAIEAARLEDGELVHLVNVVVLERVREEVV